MLAAFVAVLATEALFFAAPRLAGAFLVVGLFVAVFFVAVFFAIFLDAFLATGDDAAFLMEARPAAAFFVALFLTALFFALPFFVAVFFDPSPVSAPFLGVTSCRRWYRRAAQRWPASPPQSSQAM
ncbi:hypothetical protein M3O57_19055 [Xanthomonas nasturtii]|uniref:Uncharacterized protein n=1 Tax=Xanthomonas nasturtii TaxID=1843581 RepID=A0ABT0LTI4_9XANT|nr:hypothetical protein [Xanthomonas nasturtii]MCL1528079.1 hypothetical protein [Xanthomonas nasturtii]MCL1532405.1 hypothetical protein [Xanthomonas nasturtii]MCL1535630.1 hypothetical protein [Xanthomonas nasturtii]MCL1542443.1 hypothetical protein [Xanthomonas nasturtii]MCL1552239.1 hypothetical protein [Xanthomonas nasturtii]